MNDPEPVIWRRRRALRPLRGLVLIASAGFLIGCGGPAAGGPGGRGGGGAEAATGGRGGTAGGMGGRGGMAGGAGGASIGGRGGSGLDPTFACAASTTTASPGCGVALCGNGTRDTCQVGGSGSGFGGYGGSGITAESCDGADLSGFDCHNTFNYASGTLGCTGSCTFDFSACTECGSASTIRSCGLAPIEAFKPSAIAVAGTDTEIGVAWMGTDAAGIGGLHFTRLSPDLSVITSSSIDASAGTTSLSIASLPSGWVIAAAGDTLTLHAIGADGRAAGMTTVAASPSLAKPVLAARPGAGPVLVWMPNANADRAAVVATDGLSTTTPINLPFDGTPAIWTLDAAFVAGAVHVVTMVDDTRLQTVRIQPDGSGASLIRPSLSGLQVTSPALVAGASDLQILFYRTDYTHLLWGELDPSGAPISPAVDFGNFQGYTRPLAIADGEEAVVLVPELEGKWLRMMRLKRMTPQISYATPVTTIAYTPGTEPGLTRRGPDTIVAWIGHGDGCTAPRIKIARVNL